MGRFSPDPTASRTGDRLALPKLADPDDRPEFASLTPHAAALSGEPVRQGIWRPRRRRAPRSWRDDSAAVVDDEWRAGGGPHAGQSDQRGGPDRPLRVDRREMRRNGLSGLPDAPPFDRRTVALRCGAERQARRRTAANR